MAGPSWELGTATWVDCGRRGSLLGVPVGSLEQHGPHLPLDTDTRIACALAAALADRRHDVVVAPPVPYGASGEHQDFPGTVSAGQEGLRLYLVELLRSASSTFSRIVLVNGHGGNVGALTEVIQVVRGEGRDVRLWSPSWDGDAHAGRTETSLMLAIDPTLVRLDRAVPGCTESLDRLWPVLHSRGVRAVAPNGVLGDPSGASAAEGRALLARLAADLTGAVDRWWP